MNRTLLSVVALLTLTAGGAWSQKTIAPVKVVFVCEHGAAKSVIAAAEFERIAKQKGLAVEVVSRGTVPDAEIAAGVRKNLLADGIDLGAAKPVKVSAKDLSAATKVISFGPNLTEWLPKGAKASDWRATPAPSENYQVARAYIVKQLEALVAELQAAKVMR